MNSKNWTIKWRFPADKSFYEIINDLQLKIDTFWRTFLFIAMVVILININNSNIVFMCIFKAVNHSKNIAIFKFGIYCIHSCLRYLCLCKYIENEMIFISWVIWTQKIEQSSEDFQPINHFTSDPVLSLEGNKRRTWSSKGLIKIRHDILKLSILF